MNPSVTTYDRTAINQANAQLSTGPKTKAGKQKSSLNALRHGLTGHIVVLPTDDLKAYRQHIQSFADHFHPEGPVEAQLVQSLADTAWRQNRAAALETNLLTLGIVREPTPLEDAPPQVQDALAIAAAIDTQTRALSNLSIHTQRLARQFEKTLALLKETRAPRLEARENELRQAADLVEMHQDKEEPYDPAEDGFVFSTEEIDEFLRLRNRDLRAAHASDYLNDVDEDDYED